MEMDHVSLKLHREMLRQAARIARERDITLGQMVRDLLANEISRDAKARPPVRADERLIAPLRARLAGDLAYSCGWADLQAKLAQKGYALRASGGGLALHEISGDRRLCKASELGFSYSKLMQRFRAPFPGHPHAWLAKRVLDETQSGASDDAPDFEVIETR